MKYHEYDSPIQLVINTISSGLAMKLDNECLKAIHKCSVQIDEHTLIEALKQDSSRYREAFKRGRETGYEERDLEIVRCRDCKHVCMCDTTEMLPDIPIYAKCTLTDEVHEPDWFCADGERRTEDA